MILDMPDYGARNWYWINSTPATSTTSSFTRVSHSSIDLAYSACNAIFLVHASSNSRPCICSGISVTKVTSVLGIITFPIDIDIFFLEDQRSSNLSKLLKTAGRIWALKVPLWLLSSKFQYSKSPFEMAFFLLVGMDYIRAGIHQVGVVVGQMKS